MRVAVLVASSFRDVARASALVEKLAAKHPGCVVLVRPLGLGALAVERAALACGLQVGEVDVAYTQPRVASGVVDERAGPPRGMQHWWVEVTEVFPPADGEGPRRGKTLVASERFRTRLEAEERLKIVLVGIAHEQLELA